MPFPVTDSYGSLIRLWPESSLIWGTDTPRVTTPGETLTLAGALQAAQSTYIHTLSSPFNMATTGPFTVNDNNADDAASIAVLLSANITAGTSVAGDLTRVVSFINALSTYHLSVEPEPNWGGRITAPRTAASMGEVLLRHLASFSAGEITAAQEVIAYIANEHLDDLFQIKADDTLRFGGDTKSEEMAWASRVVALALGWIPAHASAGAWTTALPLLRAATYALKSDAFAEGYNVWENFYPDAGLEVENHSLRPHPRYEISGLQAEGAIRRVARLLGTTAWTLPHAGAIYDTLLERRYTADGGIYFPRGDDASKRNVAAWAIADAVAMGSDWTTPAIGMAYCRVHLAMMRELQVRAGHTTGRTFEAEDVDGDLSDQEIRVAGQYGEAWWELTDLATDDIT